MLPFIAVALLAQLSAAIVPELESPGGFAASSALLAVIVCAALLVPWRRLPLGAQLLLPLGYLGSLLLLMMSQEAESSGMRALVLLPIMWVALYHRVREAFVVTVCAVGVLTAVGLADDGQIDVIARRGALWAAMGVLIVLAVHNLRSWLSAAIRERDDALRHAEILTTAAAALNSTLDPEQVIMLASRLAAQTASPPGSEARRASYLRITDDTVSVAGGFDEAGQGEQYSWPLADHPYLREVVRSGSPARGRLAPAELGPSLREVVQATGIRYGAWVPVRAAGTLHGVLALASRDEPIRQAELDRCVAIGQVLEPALSNALAHARSEQAASTDPLTSLANRRGLGELFRARRGRRPFAVLSLDVDGLKAVNDRYGHAAGDELIKRAAEAARLSLRDGDVLARTGGDEFAAVVFDAEDSDLRRLAERILGAVRDAGSAALHPSVSIGAASSGTDPDAGLSDVLRRADVAMYAAKRAGGMRFEIADDLVAHSA